MYTILLYFEHYCNPTFCNVARNYFQKKDVIVCVCEKDSTLERICKIIDLDTGIRDAIFQNQNSMFVKKKKDPMRLTYERDTTNNNIFTSSQNSVLDWLDTPVLQQVTACTNLDFGTLRQSTQSLILANKGAINQLEHSGKFDCF